jgi:hypothetical protein
MFAPIKANPAKAGDAKPPAYRPTQRGQGSGAADVQQREYIKHRRCRGA